MYNPDNQYRCTIIRGKAQRDLDNLLITYATIINKIAPAPKIEFNSLFNDLLSNHFYKTSFNKINDESRKTIRNHITEISGKLFALSFEDEDSIIHPSEACKKLLDDRDQLAFFKNLCFNFQQPNGTQKIQTIKEKISIGISCRPLHLVLQVLLISHSRGYSISKTDIAYYILNSLDVLKGQVGASEIVDKIIDDKDSHLHREFDWGNSYKSQHIREQLTLLSLANLIKIEDDIVRINLVEAPLINMFVNVVNQFFKVNPIDYDFNDKGQVASFYLDWSFYNGSVNINKPEILTTTIESLGFWNSNKEILHSGFTKFNQSALTKEIGDEGEFIVLEFEKNRVGSFNKRLINKVLHFGGVRGLGYDILSVEANESLSNPEFARYIEVKTTKRSTLPIFTDDSWSDSINLTKREWLIASQFGSAYNIYRVYLTPYGNKIIKLCNPYKKSEEKLIDIEAFMYRLAFESNAIDSHYK